MVNDLVKIQVRGTYQAYINLLYGGGAAAGAALGGLFCDTIGWRLTFAIQIPLVLAIFAVAFFTVPSNLGPQLAKNSNQTWLEILREFDLAGSFSLAISVAFLILGLNLGGNLFPWSHPLVISSLIIAIVSSVLFAWVERRAKRPVLPLELMSTKPRWNLLFSNFFAMVGTNHVLFNAPLYFQAVHGDSPTTAGIRLGLPALLTTACGVSTGFYLSWSGRMKAPQVLGGIFMLLGGVMTSSMWESIPLLLASAFVGLPFVGQGFMFPATTVSVLAITSQEDQAVMSSALGLWRNLGIILGVAVSSLVMQNALNIYLDRFVTGNNKETIIALVRKSARAVQELKGKHRIEGTKSRPPLDLSN